LIFTLSTNRLHTFFTVGEYTTGENWMDNNLSKEWEASKMSKKWLAVIGAATLAGLLLAGMAGTALAQGPQPGQGTPGPGFGWGCGGFGATGSGWNMRQTMWEAAAKALDLTVDQLTAEFQAGKTLSQIAQEHNVEMATLQKALTDAQKATLDKAVADGWLTQKQADLMIDHMSDMWEAFGDSGFGPGWGPGWGMMGWGPGRGMMGWGRGMMRWGYQTPPSQ
jgi:hypothetical protein